MKKLIISIAVIVMLVATALPLAMVSADAEPALDRVTISPEEVTLSINGTQQFTAVGLDSGNATLEDVIFTWVVVAGSGNVTELGLFTADDDPGTSIVQVIGEKDGIIRSAQATVTVVVPDVLDHVLISPKHAEIEINETFQFTAVGLDSGNVTLEDVIFTWAVITGGGSISASGLFTAANVTGNSVIRVVGEKDGITKAAVATIKVKAPDDEEEKMPPGRLNGKKNGWDGGDTPPGWSKGEKEGWNGGDTPPGFSQGEKNGWGGGDTNTGSSQGGKNGWGGNDSPPGLGKGKNK